MNKESETVLKVNISFHMDSLHSKIRKLAKLSMDQIIICNSHYLFGYPQTEWGYIWKQRCKPSTKKCLTNLHK